MFQQATIDTWTDRGDFDREPEAEITGSDDMYIPTTQIQIRPTGEWHRRSAISIETACGLKYGACASREYKLEGKLCAHCFTPRERHLVDHPELVPAPDEGALR